MPNEMFRLQNRYLCIEKCDWRLALVNRRDLLQSLYKAAFAPLLDVVCGLSAIIGRAGIKGIDIAIGFFFNLLDNR